jgi:hypothetical protein
MCDKKSTEKGILTAEDAEIAEEDLKVADRLEEQ